MAYCNVVASVIDKSGDLIPSLLHLLCKSTIIKMKAKAGKKRMSEDWMFKIKHFV